MMCAGVALPLSPHFSPTHIGAAGPSHKPGAPPSAAAAAASGGGHAPAAAPPSASGELGLTPWGCCCWCVCGLGCLTWGAAYSRCVNCALCSCCQSWSSLPFVVLGLSLIPHITYPSPQVLSLVGSKMQAGTQLMRLPNARLVLKMLAKPGPRPGQELLAKPVPRPGQELPALS